MYWLGWRLSEQQGEGAETPLQQRPVTPCRELLERLLASRRLHCPSGPDTHGSRKVLHRAQKPRMWANCLRHTKANSKLLPFPARCTYLPLTPTPRRTLQNDIYPPPNLTLPKSLSCHPKSYLHIQPPRLLPVGAPKHSPVLPSPTSTCGSRLASSCRIFSAFWA